VFRRLDSVSVFRVHLSRFCLKEETESNLRNVVLNKNRKTDNVQKHNICVKFLTWMFSHSSTIHLYWDLDKECKRNPVEKRTRLLVRHIVYNLVWESVLVSTEAWNNFVLFRWALMIVKLQKIAGNSSDASAYASLHCLSCSIYLLNCSSQERTYRA
jgi:hypothetical protein